METPIYQTAGDWTTDHKADSSMIISMNKDISIYVQHGIASIYKHAELVTETEVGYMNLHHFNLFLHHVEVNNSKYN